jgi:hypothetical protein
LVGGLAEGGQHERRVIQVDVPALVKAMMESEQLSRHGLQVLSRASDMSSALMMSGSGAAQKGHRRTPPVARMIAIRWLRVCSQPKQA